MAVIKILDPSTSDSLGKLRGGGRIVQILKENLTDEAEFVSSSKNVRPRDIFLVPFWNPFQMPAVTSRVCRRQFLMIFDTIPLKYPDHFPSGLRGKLHLFLNKRALANFDGIITISDHSKRDIIISLKVPESKIHVIHPAYAKIFHTPMPAPESDVSNSTNSNLQEDTTQYDIPNTKYQIVNSKYALYVGDVNWNKNLVHLAKAIKLADVPCVFVGKPFSDLQTTRGIFKASQLSEHVSPVGTHDSGHTRGERSPDNKSGVRVDLAKKSQASSITHPWQAEFKAFLEEVGDDKRFIFLGYVEDDHLVTLYKNAVCNVLVSRDEGFGYSFLESATQATPSVLSDIPVFNEIAGDSALYAPPEDSKSIAAMIGQFFRDEAVRKMYGKKARARSKHFSPDQFRRTLLKSLV